MPNFLYLNNNPVSLLICAHPKYFGEFFQLFGISGLILPPRMYAFLKFGVLLSAFHSKDSVSVWRFIYIFWPFVFKPITRDQDEWSEWVGVDFIRPPFSTVCRVHRWPLPTHIINSSSHDDDETSSIITIA